MTDPSSLPPGLVAAGNFLVDYVKVIDHWPEQDTLANVLHQTRANGGGPYNVLVNLSRLGARFPLRAVGLLGDDANADFIVSDCRQRGIDASALTRQTEVPTSYTDVMSVQSDGRRTFFHHRGANRLFDQEHIPFGRLQGRVFLLAYLLLLDRLDPVGPDGESGVAKVLRRATEEGFLTAIDWVSVRHPEAARRARAALPQTDVGFFNEREASVALGREIAPEGKVDRGAAKEALHAFFELGIRRMAVIHFPEGAMVRTSVGETVWQPSVRLPAERIAGAVGAGDAFASGMLLGVHEGWPVEESLRLGVCTAAACLTDPSTSEGVLPWQECLRLGEQYGYRD